jgi:hypothetical protein
MARKLDWSDPHRNKTDPTRMYIRTKLTKGEREELKQWKARVASGKLSKGKIARMSGPVKVYTPEERAAFGASLNDTKEKNGE